MNDELRESILDTARRGPTVSSYLRGQLMVVAFVVLAAAATLFALDGWLRALTAAGAGFGLGLLVEGYWTACIEALAVRAIVAAEEAMGRPLGENP